jgi:hypothetical protein
MAVARKSRCVPWEAFHEELARFLSSVVECDIQPHWNSTPITQYKTRKIVTERKMKYKYPKEFVEKFEKAFKEALKLYLAGKIEYPKYHEIVKGHEAAFAVALAKVHHLALKA